MLFTSIILLILIGIVLVVLEILILPGLISGIIGSILIIIGILWMYKAFGSTVGNYTALGTAVLTLGAIIYSLKSKAWQRFGLQDSLKGKTNEVDTLELAEGDEGVTISALRPMGTVMINEKRIEAQTNGELIPSNTLITILKILPNKIIVKAKP
ncbi:MAG TPA: NfeD family protein [Bacteroidia bacterium]|nr:NfeD family protein [Bacteroidia bacterium]